MEENKDTLRTRLIIEGAKEIADNGIAGFSLRKIAAKCGTSCAAPYKHFKNKDELIIEIINYINSQWELLRNQILMIFKEDAHKQLIEVCIAYIRFFVTNPSYRKVLSAYNKESDIKEHSFLDMDALIMSYCQSKADSEEQAMRRIVSMKAKIYGITVMLEHEELPNNEKTYAMIRSILEDELK